MSSPKYWTFAYGFEKPCDADQALQKMFAEIYKVFGPNWEWEKEPHQERVDHDTYKFWWTARVKLKEST